MFDSGRKGIATAILACQLDLLLQLTLYGTPTTQQRSVSLLTAATAKYEYKQCKRQPTKLPELFYLCTKLVNLLFKAALTPSLFTDRARTKQ